MVRELVDTTDVHVSTRQALARRVKEYMDEHQIPLTETAYTALVKLWVRAGDLEQAAIWIQEAEGVQQCRVKLRLYAPLLSAHCANGRLDEALRVWLQLSRQGLTVSERELVDLWKVATHCHSQVVIERLLSDLADEVPVPSHEMTAALKEWFATTHAVDEKQETSRKGLLDQIPSDAPKIGSLACDKPWTISDGCTVDSDGILLDGCLKGSRLKPIHISEKAWSDLIAMNETIVRDGEIKGHSSKFQGGRKGQKRKLDDRAREQREHHWLQFERFLESHQPDVVVDGANVGYYETNFEGAPRHVDYKQIDWVVDDLRRQGKKVLLIMHCRHFSRQTMPDAYVPLMKRWLNDGILYRTPPGMNDDWFWMHAALSSGPGTLMVTNDELRDHHFQMLAERWFVRWKERHQVHFSFGSWLDGRRVVQLVYPEVYSRRIQRLGDGLVIPLPKQGDENRFLDGQHVADASEPAHETYLCLSS